MPTTHSEQPISTGTRPERIVSIDALRGLVMLAMIFVNDLAGAGRVVPDWMVHFSDRHASGSGMTFVDVVFPAFLFIVGMSIPFSLGAAAEGRKPLGAALHHVITRTLALLGLGVVMVNEYPSAENLGWSPALWATLFYAAAILAFCSWTPRASGRITAEQARGISRLLRGIGVVGAAMLAKMYVGADGHRIISFSPFALHTSWWGILGLIGWSYLTGALVFLVFRTRRTALLGSMVLLFSLFAAERSGTFAGWWLSDHVQLGSTIGSHAAITVAGLLLATILVTPETSALGEKVRFTAWFVIGCALGAVLLEGTYGTSKNAATPSWCLWSCAITAGLWLLFHFLSDVRRVDAIGRPLALAGQNVLLAYLLAAFLPSLLTWIGLGDAYARIAELGLAAAILRSLLCSVAIVALTVALNQRGFRLRL